MTDALAALCAHQSQSTSPPAKAECPGSLSQSLASAHCTALELIADQEAFESLVAQHKLEYINDPDTHACIQWATVQWVLDALTQHNPNLFLAGGQSWEDVLF